MVMIRHMTDVRIVALDPRLDLPGLLPAALGLTRRAADLGLLPDRPPIERLDLGLVREIGREAMEAGLGRDVALELLHADDADPGALESAIRRLDGALIDSPIPQREIPALLGTYGLDGLAELAGASAASLRRYTAGTRAVPDAVAARIHFVALVTSDLAGSYNAFGLRRWWERPRAALGGRSPREALARDWSPDMPEAIAVAALAAALAGDTGVGLADGRDAAAEPEPLHPSRAAMGARPGSRGRR